MQLSSSQERRIKSHLSDHMRNCPVCGGNNFSLGGLNYQEGLDSEYMQPTRGQMIPVVSVVCDNCYLVLNFAAKPTGVVD